MVEDSHDSQVGRVARGGRVGSGWGVWVIVLVIGCIAVAAVGLPLAGVAVQLSRAVEHPVAATTETPVFVWGAVWNTAVYSLGIGVLATMLGLPAAWTMRRAGAWWVGLVIVPLLMPMYLTYAGWGMLRDPGSWLGDWLATGPKWLQVGFDRWRAFVALGLWAWPLAAMVVGAEARRIPSHLLDALELEPAGAWRKSRLVLGMLAGSMGVSVVLIALVMAGSAIPLHLAQVDTYAIHLWKYLTLTAEPGSVWPASTPLLVMAGVAGWAMVRAAERPRTVVRDDGSAPGRAESTGVRVAAGLVWGVSVLGPLAVFAWHLRRWGSVADFWRLQSESVLLSVRNGAVVGGLVVALGLGAWAVRACRRRGMGNGLSRGVLWVLVATALVPGVLVGSATLGFWNAAFIPRAAGNTMWPVVLAHVARFGFLGVLAGWWLAGLETADERGARLMLGGDGVRGWAALCVRPNVGPVIGVGLAAMALSLHEIEATVMLQVAGPTSLAQYVLSQLHYNRNEELCAACLNLMTIGIVVAGGAGWLIGRARRG